MLFLAIKMSASNLQQGQKVENMSGTSSYVSKDDTWRQTWEKRSGQSWPSKCSIQSCNDKATDGAHVQVRGESNNRVPGDAHIIPMCHDCNMNKKNEHSVKANTTAVKVTANDLKNKK